MILCLQAVHSALLPRVWVQPAVTLPGRCAGEPQGVRRGRSQGAGLQLRLLPRGGHVHQGRTLPDRVQRQVSRKALLLRLTDFSAVSVFSMLFQPISHSQFLYHYTKPEREAAPSRSSTTRSTAWTCTPTSSCLYAGSLLTPLAQRRPRSRTGSTS